MIIANLTIVILITIILVLKYLIRLRQSELGDIVFVELPETDDEINEGDTFGSVESVKTVSELYAPISGKVVEVNEELEDSPEFVNESPYEKAWMVKVEISDESQIEALLTAEKYSEMIGE